MAAFLPDTIASSVCDCSPIFTHQDLMNERTSPSSFLFRNFTHSFPNSFIQGTVLDLVEMRPTTQPHQAAAPSFAQPKMVGEMIYRLPLRPEPYQVFELISFKPKMSNAWSATSRFNLLFCNRSGGFTPRSYFTGNKDGNGCVLSEQSHTSAM